tara:strand:+ start:95985 stop:97133 length:1149 start_codon:yes stop_codon:yes gene_type:complete
MTESSVINSNTHRAQALQIWFRSLFPKLSPASRADDFTFSLVQGDASFRRYFRAQNKNESYILVDAPPEKEDSHPFVSIATAFSKAGVKVPRVYEVDYKQGFMCLTDFGDTLLWEKLKQSKLSDPEGSDATFYYQLCFAELLKIQRVATENLPVFSAELLRKEMHLFQQWFCEGILDLNLSSEEQAMFERSFDALIEIAQSQFQLCVHRDFHSRNLLVVHDFSGNTASNSEAAPLIGVIDFQDAVKGPYTYDLVSLLKDCYIAWPRNQVNAWALQYRELMQQKITIDVDPGDFLREFDLMGAQRHLKAVGIFSRLFLRDHKITYLADIPRTLAYLYGVATEYNELKDFSVWLDKNVMQDVESKILSVVNRKDNRKDNREDAR